MASLRVFMRGFVRLQQPLGGVGMGMRMRVGGGGGGAESRRGLHGGRVVGYNWRWPKELGGGEGEGCVGDGLSFGSVSLSLARAVTVLVSSVGAIGSVSAVLDC
jgi:hypothetical protein